MMTGYHAHGKFLISGEYFVLRGVNALAVPLKLGQHLEVNTTDGSAARLHWKALNHDQTVFFETRLDTRSLEPEDLSDPRAQRLSSLLKAARKRNPGFLIQNTGLEAISRIDFPREWGLGSSSTLISLIAQWSGVSAHELLREVWGGSGYDVACATAKGPILYRLDQGQGLNERVQVDYPFADHLYFVYLGQKQDSSSQLQNFSSIKYNEEAVHAWINTITASMLQCRTLEKFEQLMEEHESITAEVLGLQPVQQRLFADFEGKVKSLGAWGGDFVLMSWRGSFDALKQYLAQRAYQVCIPWSQIVLE
jgi:mevalonate kinase